jgi:hypothetical protein
MAHDSGATEPRDPRRRRVRRVRRYKAELLDAATRNTPVLAFRDIRLHPAVAISGRLRELDRRQELTTARSCRPWRSPPSASQCSLPQFSGTARELRKLGARTPKSLVKRSRHGLLRSRPPGPGGAKYLALRRQSAIATRARERRSASILGALDPTRTEHRRSCIIAGPRPIQHSQRVVRRRSRRAAQPRSIVQRYPAAAPEALHLWKRPVARNRPERDAATHRFVLPGTAVRRAAASS